MIFSYFKLFLICLYYRFRNIVFFFIGAISDKSDWLFTYIPQFKQKLVKVAFKSFV